MLQFYASILIFIATWVVIRIVVGIKVHVYLNSFEKKAKSVRLLYELIKQYIESEDGGYEFVIRRELKRYKLDNFSNSREAVESYEKLVEDTLDQYEWLRRNFQLDNEYYEIMTDIIRRYSDIKYKCWHKATGQKE